MIQLSLEVRRRSGEGERRGVCPYGDRCCSSGGGAAVPARVRRSLLSFPLQARLCCRGEGAGPIALFENVRFAWRPFPFTSTLCRERRKIVSRVPECERVRRHAHVTFHYPQDLRVLHARGGPLPPAEHAPEDARDGAWASQGTWPACARISMGCRRVTTLSTSRSRSRELPRFVTALTPNVFCGPDPTIAWTSDLPAATPRFVTALTPNLFYCPDPTGLS